MEREIKKERDGGKGEIEERNRGEWKRMYLQVRLLIQAHRNG